MAIASPIPAPPVSETSARQREIVSDYMRVIDEHLVDIVEGRATVMFEIQDVADVLCIHPTHLRNTVKLVTGRSSCDYFEDRIVETAKAMLADRSRSVGDIAANLTYDPSNFTKFFKKFVGMTPKAYREQLWRQAVETDAVTI